MKILITIFLLCSSISYAGIPKIKAKEVTCQYLRDAFASYKSVYVIYGFLGRFRTTFWETKEDAELNCHYGVKEGSFQAIDSTCKVGYGCADPVIDYECRPRRYCEN
jgi:hypothetical protein